MAILVQCSCGAKFNVKDELAGKRVACPKCKQPLQINKPAATDADPLGLGDLGQLSSGPPAAARTPAPRGPAPARSPGAKPMATPGKAPAKAAGAKSSNSRVVLILALVGGGLFLLILACGGIGLLVALWGMSTDSQGSLGGPTEIASPSTSTSSGPEGLFNLLPQGVQDAVGRLDSANAKKIGRAMHEYHEIHRGFPSASANAAGQSGLSWRVHLLPLLGEKALYDQFNLDDPWDSPQNMALIERMPEIYRVPGVSGNKTAIHVFVGPDTPFGGEKGTAFRDIVDGTSNTIMLVVGSDETAAEWTKPGGIEFDPSNPSRGLRKVGSGYPAILIDGSARLIPGDTSPEDMSKLITYNDLQVYGGQFGNWP